MPDGLKCICFAGICHPNWFGKISEQVGRTGAQLFCKMTVDNDTLPASGGAGSKKGRFDIT